MLCLNNELLLEVFVFFNFLGIPIRTTMDNSTTVQYAGLLHQLSAKARSTIRDIDPTNDLTFLRIRSKKHEIMVAPGNQDYMYSKTCLKRSLKITPKLFFSTNLGDYRLMQVKSIAECSNWSILQYFRPPLSYHCPLRL